MTRMEEFRKKIRRFPKKMKELGKNTVRLLKDVRTYKAIFSEFVGTLFLSFLVGGAAISCMLTANGATESLMQTTVHPKEKIIDCSVVSALTVGFSLASLVQAIGHISGGHVNPAVTFAFFVTGRINPVVALLYFLMQCLGCLAGAGLLIVATAKTIENKDEEYIEWNYPVEGLASSINDVKSSQAFLLEAMTTFLLVFTIFAVCDENRTDVKGSAPLAIGIAGAACSFAGGRFSGASMNPAVSFAFAVADKGESSWDNHWVYWVGPLVGGAVAGWIYHGLLRAPKVNVEQLQQLKQIKQLAELQVQEIRYDQHRAAGQEQRRHSLTPATQARKASISAESNVEAGSEMTTNEESAPPGVPPQPEDEISLAYSQATPFASMSSLPPQV